MLDHCGSVGDGRCPPAGRPIPPAARGGRCPPASHVPTGTALALLVQDYIARHRARKRLENEGWLGTFDDRLPAAAYGRTPSGFKHSHQQILTDTALMAGVTAARQREAELRAATEFETLFDIADEIMRATGGLGPMWRYDFGQRIGAALGVEPVDVYVARGALRGARNLGLLVVRGRIRRANLPPALRALTSDEAEDFLCIYKKHLNFTIAAEDWRSDDVNPRA